MSEVEEKVKTITIIVDGTPHEVPKKEEITYAEVVTLGVSRLPPAPRDHLLGDLHAGPPRGDFAAGRHRQGQGRDGIPC